jgi:hypothetical protein
LSFSFVCNNTVVYNLFKKKDFVSMRKKESKDGRIDGIEDIIIFEKIIS